MLFLVCGSWGGMGIEDEVEGGEEERREAVSAVEVRGDDGFGPCEGGGWSLKMS